MNPTQSPIKPSISVTFLNNVEEADIWILPQTEDNPNSSLWGTPTVSKMRVGEQKAVTVSDERTGRYIVRIIDCDQAFYAASDVVLDDGYTIRFEMEETKYDASITVLDQNGNAAFVKESVFEGVFGTNQVGKNSDIRQSADATMIQRHLAQLTTIPEDRLVCADTDKDGKINITDVTMIQRFIAQIIPSLQFFIQVFKI